MNHNQRRLIITAVPLVICNLIAFTGQLSFIRDHMSWPLIGDIGLAAGLESIALFLTFMAADALMAEDSALRLRIGSYIAAAIVASLNYSHYAGPHGRPTFAAIATGLMSFMSPILWGIFSRRNSRDALKAKGLIENRAVKFGMNRWLWWPRRTFSVYRLAAWTGEQNPKTAIFDYENTMPEPEPVTEIETGATHDALPEPEPARALPGATPEPARVLPGAAPGAAPEPVPALHNTASKADAVRHALRALSDGNAGTAPSPREVSAWLAERGITATPGYVRDVLRRDRAARARAQPANVRPIDSASGPASPTAQVKRQAR